MGLILYGGYYDKAEALQILNNMKYYKRNLEPSKKIDERSIGIIPYIKLYEDKSHEDFLADKLKTVKSILDKHGDEAIDAFQELTSPNENDFLMPLKKFSVIGEDEEFSKIIDELSIPMKKDEFYHYLDIYNQFYK